MAFVYAVATHTVFLNCNFWYLGVNVPDKPRVFMPLASGYTAYTERCTMWRRTVMRASLSDRHHYIAESSCGNPAYPCCARCFYVL